MTKVAIVGRPNVGKSSLFNRLQSSHQNPFSMDRAIVFHKSGTTREGKTAMCRIGSLEVELHDTGGIESEELTEVSELLLKMRERVVDTILNSDVVLVVVDAKEGILPLDKSVGQLVSDNHSNVVLVANKAEGSMMECVADCYEMNLGDPVLVSAKANEGIDDLVDRISLQAIPTADIVEETIDTENWTTMDPAEAENWTTTDSFEDATHTEGFNMTTDSFEDATEAEGFTTNTDVFESSSGFSGSEIRRVLKSTDPTDAKLKALILKERQMALLRKPVQIGIIGRPNAGKSSLLNALINENRAIVDDCPGTTTDAIAVNWNFYKHQLRLVDTAGIMRGWKHATGGEDFKDAGAQTLRTITTSHVCVLVIDAHEAFKSNTLKFPSRQEVKLGHEVIDSGKCLVIAVNKWDLIPETQRPKFRRGLGRCIQEAFHDVRNLPVVFISTKQEGSGGTNLNTLLVSCVSAYRKWNIKLQSSKLNSWLEAFVAHHPPPWKDGQKQYPKFITQTKTRPPTFSLFTNTFASFPDNYLRQMKELLKEEFGLKGVPIRVNLRSTLMPKPGKKLRDRDVARWKRLGPKQAAAVERIRSK